MRKWNVDPPLYEIGAAVNVGKRVPAKGTIKSIRFEPVYTVSIREGVEITASEHEIVELWKGAEEND